MAVTGGEVARQRRATSARWEVKRAAWTLAAESMGVVTGASWLVTGRAEHVVTCGDSTGYAPPFPCSTLVFDPPWDQPAVAPPGPWASRLAFTNGRHLADALRLFGPEVTWQFIWNCQSVHAIQRRPKLAHKSCLWYGDLAGYVASAETRRRYGDAVPPHLMDLTSLPLTRILAAGSHPHEKPLAWVTSILAHCSEGAVFDPFAGSGTTLLACDALGRASVSVEIEPYHVAVILARAMVAGCAVQRT